MIAGECLDFSIFDRFTENGHIVKEKENEIQLVISELSERVSSLSQYTDIMHVKCTLEELKGRVAKEGLDLDVKINQMLNLAITRASSKARIIFSLVKGGYNFIEGICNGVLDLSGTRCSASQFNSIPTEAKVSIKYLSLRGVRITDDFNFSDFINLEKLDTQDCPYVSQKAYQTLPKGG